MKCKKPRPFVARAVIFARAVNLYIYILHWQTEGVNFISFNALDRHESTDTTNEIVTIGFLALM